MESKENIQSAINTLRQCIESRSQEVEETMANVQKLPIEVLQKKAAQEAEEAQSKSYSTSREKHNSLVSLCSFCEFYYNRTLELRVNMDLGIIYISRNFYPEYLMTLSDDELEKRIHSIEKPWWNDMYEDIKDDEKILVILWKRSCNLQDLEKLHQLWVKGDMEKIDSIYATTLRRSKFLGRFNMRWIHLFLDNISLWKSKLLRK